MPEVAYLDNVITGYVMNKTAATEYITLKVQSTLQLHSYFYSNPALSCTIPYLLVVVAPLGAASEQKYIHQPLRRWVWNHQPKYEEMRLSTRTDISITHAERLLISTTVMVQCCHFRSCRARLRSTLHGHGLSLQRSYQVQKQQTYRPTYTCTQKHWENIIWPWWHFQWNVAWDSLSHCLLSHQPV